jgi:hypothetical protein
VLEIQENTVRKIQDVILTAAIGYESKALIPFLASLRKVSNVRVVLIIEDAQLDKWRELQEKYSAELFPVSTQKDMVPHVERYFFYKKFLEVSNGISRVFITDSRDVIFQSSPFPEIGEYFFVYAEPRLIGDCQINRRWIEKYYGVSFVDRVSALPILCSGTTQGSYKLIKEYVEVMCREIENKILENFIVDVGDDQGIHNYLIYSNKLPLAKIQNHGLSEVQTLHYATVFQFDRQCFLLNEDGRPVPVIHQYDRFPQFFPIFQRMLNSD